MAKRRGEERKKEKEGGKEKWGKIELSDNISSHPLCAH